MALFLSTTTNKIDKKGRVSVPAQFRTVLAIQNLSGVVLYRSFQQPIIEGCDYARLVRLSERIEASQLDASQLPTHENGASNFNNYNNDYTAMMFAESQILTFDAEGRISIPTFLLDHAGITDMITFVGRGPTFELWNPSRFEESHIAMRDRLFQPHSQVPHQQPYQVSPKPVSVGEKS